MSLMPSAHDDEDDDLLSERPLTKKPKGKEAAKTNGEGKKKIPGRPFEKGNKGGPGNPNASKVAAYKMAYYLAHGTKEFHRALKITYDQLFGRDPLTGERVHADASDRLAWCKLNADRLMGKVPQTIYTPEGVPPADLDNDPEASVYD